MLLDCHSFHKKSLSYEMNQTTNSPAVLLGSDDCHTAGGLLERTHYAFKRQEHSVAVNTPFGGFLMPFSRYQQNRQVKRLLIEASQGLHVGDGSD